MSVLLIQILFFMTCTFVLGLMLGYLLWRFGTAQKIASMSSDLKFWRDNLEQSRIEREVEIRRIEELTRERAILKKRLASQSS
ncbi:hypothetical protein DFP92_101829 [Yoonia sediminilitoris]|uniref:Uncharacterized protein n=1 Tax=Yoonia sediminilitoris TaxID=1286148 RepID=A0A2T6KRQ1_9RHOB|nr:hypothetical protein C8N45_101829 [Yoonia sediminilitoris]RCW99402.1 hypothetical protein DFP92_101829 [Yoonia sediminilitoris]